MVLTTSRCYVLAYAVLLIFGHHQCYGYRHERKERDVDSPKISQPGSLFMIKKSYDPQSFVRDQIESHLSTIEGATGGMSGTTDPSKYVSDITYNPPKYNKTRFAAPFPSQIPSTFAEEIPFIPPTCPISPPPMIRPPVPRPTRPVPRPTTPRPAYASPKPRPTPAPLPIPRPTVAGSWRCNCGNCHQGCWEPRRYQEYQQWGSRRPRSTNSHVLEDDQAQFGEFPWMVAVLDQNNLFIAGGSLVAPRVVLTAGHKVYNRNISLLARVGEWDITSAYEKIPSQDIDVKEILFHPEFNHLTLVNNIALLILQNDVVIGRTVMPICLPASSSLEYYNYDIPNCLIMGWDKNVFEKTGRNQEIMKKVPITTVNHSTCKSSLRETQFVSQFGQDFNLDLSFICAGGQGEPNSECGINEGSPLVCPSPINPSVYVQVGVMSWSEKCGVVGNPSVFAYVDYHILYWIRTIIINNGGFV